MPLSNLAKQKMHIYNDVLFFLYSNESGKKSTVAVKFTLLQMNNLNLLTCTIVKRNDYFLKVDTVRALFPHYSTKPLLSPLRDVCSQQW